MLAKLKDLLSKTFDHWTADEAPRMGASLAYYTILSLSPLLIVLITIAGYVFGREAAQGTLFYQIDQLVGTEGAKAIQGMVEAAGQHKSTGLWASVAGFAALLFAASGVIGELRSSLNKIWNVPEANGAAISSFVKEKGYAIAVVLGTGFLLLVALVVNAAISALGKYFQSMISTPAIVLQLFNIVVSFAVITVLFALIYKVLPQADVRWQDVMYGAAVTSVLFTIGKTLIGVYLGHAGFSSTYGAAGSLVVVLVWVYYSAQIFFFGAEFTHVYALEHGSLRERKGAVAGKVTPQLVPAQETAALPKKTEPVPHPERWQAQGVIPGSPAAAATGGAQLLPILPLDKPSTEEHFTIAQDVAAIVGSVAGFGKVVVDQIRKPVKPEDSKVS